MANKNRVVSMEKYKRKQSWNIGVFIFGLIFIYLLITVITYMTKDKVAIYEVREGSILNDTAYSGIVLREETVVNTESDGYINYFTEAGQKIAVGSNVYTLSAEQLESTDEIEVNEEVALSDEEWNSIQLKAQTFNKSFKNTSFSSASQLKQETNAIIQNKTTQNRVIQLNTLLADANMSGISVYTAADDGIIQFSVDGMENLELKDLTKEHLEKINYTKTELTNNTKVTAGSPAYRLITDEEWTVIFLLDKKMEETLLEKMGERTTLTVKVRFLKDNESMRGTLEIFHKGKDDAYGYITFSDSMIRYASERYLDIELILEDESGLKIPKSSVTEKEFYVVPEEYLTTGGSSKETGVLRQTEDKDGDVITEFLPVTVFYKDSETGMAYLDPADFEKNDTLIMPESTQTMALGKTDSLKGVYNVNKGFAVFKRIEILCESEEYYIIEEGSSYGLANYDYIALDGSSVVEDQLVNQ